MELSIILAIMAIALAIFTIGLANIPQNVLSRMLFGKQEDIIVINTFLGIMGIAGFYGFIVFSGFLIANLTTVPANYLALSWHWQTWWLQTIFGFVAALLVYVFIIWAYKNAVRIAKKKNNTQPKEIGNVISNTIKPNINNADIGINADLANMNSEQIKAFNNYINYLKKELDTENCKRISKKKGDDYKL